MFDYHYEAVSDACIIAHAVVTMGSNTERGAGIFLDFMRRKDAETWLGSQTFLITRLSLSKSEWYRRMGLQVWSHKYRLDGRHESNPWAVCRTPCSDTN